MDDDATFAEAPRTLGEARSAKTQNGADWSPRDLLVRMLRDIDSGTQPIEAMVVTFMGPNGAGFWSATPDATTALGLLAQATLSVGVQMPTLPPPIK